MKRLLVAGSGPIYQICKAFRDGEAGRLHNPEFTLLEWYRPGFDRQQLMAEVTELIAPLLAAKVPFPVLAYRDVFQQQLSLDPLQATLSELQSFLEKEQLADVAALDKMVEQDARDFCLDLIFSHCLQAGLGHEGPVFVDAFPVSQAALAKVTPDADGALVAERFELFYHGIELANGYHELTDADEQRCRFAADNDSRNRQDIPLASIDERFCQALVAGMPESSGVALGLDRLLLSLSTLETLDQVLAFSVRRI